ncbi:MAG: hypothetical protein LEGION0398_MBIBDBAK_00400 [Legionellaceae bacterium]
MTGKILPSKTLTVIPFVKNQIEKFVSEKQICSYEAFLAAAEKGDITAFEQLSYTDDHLEAKDNEGFTALHLAAGYGLAAYQGHEAIVAQLVNLGADKEAKDKYGRTALNFAAANGDVPTVAQLVNLGAETEAKDNEGATALHLAAIKGHEATVTQLVNLGADKEAKNNNGNTPLHLAAIQGHAPTIVQLVQYGASLKIENEKKQTPLDVAKDDKTRKLMQEQHLLYKQQGKEEVSRLRQIVEMQQQEIEALKSTLSKIMEHLNLNNENVASTPFSYGLFNKKME